MPKASGSFLDSAVVFGLFVFVLKVRLWFVFHSGRFSSVAVIVIKGYRL